MLVEGKLKLGTLLGKQMAREKRPMMTWWRNSNHIMKFFFAAAFCAMIVIPLILTEYNYSPLQTLLAILLVDICLYPSARYFARNESCIPTMAVFCGSYAFQFAFPVFTRDATIQLAYGEIKYLQDVDVSAALLLAIVGICALQAGYRWFQRSRFKRVVPTAHLRLNKGKAVLYCVLVGILVPLLFTFKAIIPEEYQLPLSSILRLLQNQILVVIGVLGWLLYSRKESKLYAVWLYGLVFLAAMRGVSTGTLEDALVPIVVLLVVKWLYTGKVPIGPIIATIAMVIFLSPVKADYRERVRYGDAEDNAEQSNVSKGYLWIEQASEYWKVTLAGSRDLVEATSSATGRADFIHQVAHIYSLTPSAIPWQYGTTYSYFAVALVPRVLWPDKPQAGSANSFFAITYGIATEEGAKTTTFGVSLLGEAYINFGWYGVAFVMLLLGIILGLLQHSFGEFHSGPGGQAVFLAFFVFFLNGIGSSAEILFGNILQNLLCGYFLLLWAREKPSKTRMTEFPLVHPAMNS
jgi:hypothetical protein